MGVCSPGPVGLPLLLLLVELLLHLVPLVIHLPLHILALVLHLPLHVLALLCRLVFADGVGIATVAIISAIQ